MSFTLKTRCAQRGKKAAIQFAVLYQGRNHGGEKNTDSDSKNVSKNSILKALGKEFIPLTHRNTQKCMT